MTESAASMERIYTLKQAVEVFFPGGPWTVSSLRTEIRKGRLVAMRIAGRLAVTEAGILEMRRLCREEPKASGNGSAARQTWPQTEDAKLALAAGRATAKALSESCRVKRGNASAKAT